MQSWKLRVLFQCKLVEHRPPVQVLQSCWYVNRTRRAYKMAALTDVVNWTIGASTLWMSYIVGSPYRSWKRPHTNGPLWCATHPWSFTVNLDPAERDRQEDSLLVFPFGTCWGSHSLQEIEGKITWGDERMWAQHVRAWHSFLQTQVSVMGCHRWDIQGGRCMIRVTGVI